MNMNSFLMMTTDIYTHLTLSDITYYPYTKNILNCPNTHHRISNQNITYTSILHIESILDQIMVHHMYPSFSQDDPQI